MRILLQCSGLPPMVGGAETIAGNLATGLGRRGHQVLVLTPAERYELDDDRFGPNVSVVGLPSRDALASRRLDALKAVEARLTSIRDAFRADILHLHDVREGGFLFRRPNAHESARVLTLHAPAHEGSATGLAGALVATAARIIAVSASHLEDARQRYAADADRMRLVRNAVPNSTEAGAYPIGSGLFVCLGRLVPEKGFDFALEAFAAVLPNHPDARLAIVGVGAGAPALAELATRLEIFGAVSFLGAVDPAGVVEILDRAAAVLVPSKWREPFGLVALEASWRARPVLASRSGGLAEIVEDGVTGFLLPPDDPGAWTQAMRRVLANPDEAAALGAAGRRRAEQEFAFDAFLEAHERVYAEARGP